MCRHIYLSQALRLSQLFNAFHCVTSIYHSLRLLLYITIRDMSIGFEKFSRLLRYNI
uniref:Uncharacterized protein n=1 Tax=Myoviridae sp. ctOyc4 TaxID=2827606 RepID=A0A8S5LQ44_9CAUD|nr:MAG TPA: hypothetical protein [Myoviridae sp. ctOyc4]